MKIKIRRTTGWQHYSVDLPSTASVLDALEEIKRQDSSLLFRHSCHHGSCGSCGVIINGREKLACLTQLNEAGKTSTEISIEPLHNFPLIGDLLIDFSPFYERLDEIDHPPVQTAQLDHLVDQQFYQFDHCIECGLCISACPISGSDPQYLGAASLAATWRLVANGQFTKNHYLLIDDDHGVWQCHAAFECTEVCPSHIDPAKSIMSLRHIMLTHRLNV